MNIIPHFSDKAYSTFANFFNEYKDVMTKPAFSMYLLTVTSVIIFDRIRSIKYIYEHFIMKFIPVSLNSFYYFLSYSEVKIEKLIEAAVKTVVSYIMPIYRGLNIFIIIDDTLIPKYGTHFDCYMKHFDHCKRNNSSFLMGHSFVCICISIPVKIDHGEVQYLTIPVGIKLYSGEESKLKLSSDLIKIVMKHLSGYQVVLLCDSWYTKGEVLETVKIFPNLNLFGAVRADTALFEVPEKTSGRGRPRIR